jgi:hypothetical protein
MSPIRYRTMLEVRVRNRLASLCSILSRWLDEAAERLAVCPRCRRLRSLEPPDPRCVD